MHRIDVPLERRTRPEWDDGRFVLDADTHCVDYVLLCAREDHRVRRHVGRPRKRMAVLNPNGLGNDQSIPESRSKRMDKRFRRTRTRLVLPDLNSKRASAAASP
jgi:hypothetical protein